MAIHKVMIVSPGYKGIICARLDNEYPGQPSFAEIATAAEQFGLKAFHNPVSGQLSKANLSALNRPCRNSMV